MVKAYGTDGTVEGARCAILLLAECLAHHLFMTIRELEFYTWLYLLTHTVTGGDISGLHAWLVYKLVLALAVYSLADCDSRHRLLYAITAKRRL